MFKLVDYLKDFEKREFAAPLSRSLPQCPNYGKTDDRQDGVNH